ncbi:MAG: hypothetical protein Q9222_001974 [Ikaeria aurantiellina]
MPFKLPTFKKKPKPKEGYWLYTTKIVTPGMESRILQCPLPCPLKEDDLKPPYFSVNCRYRSQTTYLYIDLDLNDGLKKLVPFIEARKIHQPGSPDFRAYDKIVKQMVGDFSMPYAVKKGQKRYSFRDVHAAIREVSGRYPAEEWVYLHNAVYNREREMEPRELLKQWEVALDDVQYLLAGGGD